MIRFFVLMAVMLISTRIANLIPDAGYDLAFADLSAFVNHNSNLNRFSYCLVQDKDGGFAHRLLEWFND